MTEVRRGAGILFVTKAGRALFLKRGPGGDAPGFWCFPGGTIEGDETPEQAALREAKEELGSVPKGTRLLPHVRAITPMPPVVSTTELATAQEPYSVDYTTFVSEVAEEFAPTIDGEHVGYAWAPVTEPPEPMHPGCRVALQRLSWDELGVAKAIRDGVITSPQRFGSFWMFDLRVTGTGAARRNERRDEKGNVTQEAEFVWRRPENYLTPEFVERCNGLPVVMLHPEKAVLDSDEFLGRVVGALMMAYVKGDEVWGVARVYDEDAVKLLVSKQMSTSPGVVLGGGDYKLRMEDGTRVLVEGKPTLLDHLAICPQGVWDKGGEPRGVRKDSQYHQGETHMPLDDGDKKVVADMLAAALAPLNAALLGTSALARHDDGGQKLDKMLSAMDAMCNRMDGFEKKMDAHGARMDAEEEKEKKDRKDARFGARKDGESDDDFKKRCDADEEMEKKDAMMAGDPEPVAADKAKKRRHDAEASDEKEKKDRKEAKKDASAESGFTQEQVKQMLADVEARVRRDIPKQPTDEERHQFGVAQVRCDDVQVMFGKRAPFALAGESLLAYRRRMAHDLKAFSPRFKDIDVLGTAIHDSAFSIAEDIIYADAKAAAANPPDLKENEIRAIPKTDSVTGLRTTEFVGARSFIHGIKRPPRWVQKINVRTSGEGNPAVN